MRLRVVSVATVSIKRQVSFEVLATESTLIFLEGGGVVVIGVLEVPDRTVEERLVGFSQ
jgi:hypothetical protein